MPGLQLHSGYSDIIKQIAMNGKNRPLVTDEPVEFEKQPVEVLRLQEKLQIIFEEYFRFIEENLKDQNT